MDPWKDPPGWRTELRWGVATALGGNGVGAHVHEELMAAYVGGRKEARDGR